MDLGTRPAIVMEGITVSVTPDPASAGREAGVAAAASIAAATRRQGSARVIFASAPSQEAMLAELISAADIDWAKVQAFHMDEYVGLPAQHPQAFGQWLEERLASVDIGSFERIDPSEDPAREARRYAALIAAGPVDVVCMGIGVNGHIAFNEPDATRFDDPDRVRVVELDAESRKQQVDDGLFPGIDDVPTEAVTLTVPALLAAREVVVTVLGERKAPAVSAALAGPVGPHCPASAIRSHRSARVFLDRAAAARLPARPR